METEFLIIGAGFGGLETAIHLRHMSELATITIVSQEPHLVYKPWLVYLPAQRRQFDQCLIPLEHVAEQFRLRLVVDTVTKVSPDERQVRLTSGASMHYAQVVIATGSAADREAIAGAQLHAVFPCEVEEAQRFREHFLAMKQGTVTLIIGGPRPGPGLEYAGWMARSLQEKHLVGAIHLQLIDSQPHLMAQLGARASSMLERIMSKQGVQLLTGQAVQEITPSEVYLHDELRIASDLTAVVGPLRGVDLKLPRPLIDESGFVCVNASFQSPSHPDLFAVGDAVALPWGTDVPKTMGMARKQAEIVAHNLLAQAGNPCTHSPGKISART